MYIPDSKADVLMKLYWGVSVSVFEKNILLNTVFPLVLIHKDLLYSFRWPFRSFYAIESAHSLWFFHDSRSISFSLFTSMFFFAQLYFPFSEFIWTGKHFKWVTQLRICNFATTLDTNGFLLICSAYKNQIAFS